MASLSLQTLLSLTNPKKTNARPFANHSLLQPILPQNRNKQKNSNKTNWILSSTAREEVDVITVQSQDCTDMQEGMVVAREDQGELASQVGGFGDGTLTFEGFSSVSSSMVDGEKVENEEIEKWIDRTINAAIVLAAGSFAITKLLTIDHDYWHGWTIFEILRYAPQHNWTAYEEALKKNPVLAKMMISGVVYSLGDWIAQAGWKLWPFAHLVTYGLIPVQQRLLWVDCVELIWVTILSTYSNEKSEARLVEAPVEAQSGPIEDQTK